MIPTYFNFNVSTLKSQHGHLVCCVTPRFFKAINCQTYYENLTDLTTTSKKGGSAFAMGDGVKISQQVPIEIWWAKIKRAFEGLILIMQIMLFLSSENPCDFGN